MKKRCATPAVRSACTALSVAACLFTPALQARAASSEWAVSQGGAVRIVAEPPLADGSIPAILDIRLEPGWKTYWLEPGASGIPPQVTIDPATGIVSAGLRFPAPKTFDDGVVRYTGYDRSVALPIELRRSARDGGVDIKASVFLGICKDICIPLKADLTVALPAGTAANPLEQARIDDAIAALPGAPAADLTVTATAVDGTAKILRIAFLAPGIAQAAPEVFLAGPAGFSFGKPRVSAAKTGGFVAEVPYHAPFRDADLKGKSAIIVLRAGQRSMQTSLAFD